MPILAVGGVYVDVLPFQVSIGTGTYPKEELGNIDVQDFLFFGKQWFKFRDLIGTIRRRAKDLIHLLTNAVSQHTAGLISTFLYCGYVHDKHLCINEKLFV